MNIKNIIFDIGGVLAEPKTGHWFITPNFWNIVDKKLIDREKLEISMKMNMYLQTQEPKTEKEEHYMFSKYYYKVLDDINYPNLSTEVADKIANDCVYNNEKFLFYNDNKKVLKVLSKKYNLYIISNGWPSSFRVLKNNEIDKYFNDIIISSMYTTTKEEELFDIFLNKHKNVNPKETLYIDDRTYILDKANKYNFNLLLMDRKDTYKENKYKTIKSMNDIIVILK